MWLRVSLYVMFLGSLTATGGNCGCLNINNKYIMQNIFVWLWYSLLLSFYILILVQFFAQLGSELCTGTEIVDTPEECKEAARQLDLLYQGTESHSSFPKGCYKYDIKNGNKKVFWNTHSIGSESSTTHPICKKSE